jgi:hypothetical protein
LFTSGYLVVAGHAARDNAAESPEERCIAGRGQLTRKASSAAQDIAVGILQNVPPCIHRAITHSTTATIEDLLFAQKTDGPEMCNADLVRGSTQASCHDNQMKNTRHTGARSSEYRPEYRRSS